jgi:hypothetical protein
MCLIFLFILFVVPESFSKEKRVQLQKKREEERAERAGNPQRLSFVTRTLSKLGTAFEPFRQLKPTTNPRTGKRNYRLILCAVHGFLTELATSAAVTNMIVYAAAVYDYKPSTVS